MKAKIVLDTLHDVTEFVQIVSSVPSRVNLEDSDGHVVSAKSLLGAIYTMEWNEIYCTCETDISSRILRFIDW